MQVRPIAHAGLQDCADAHMDCMPGFGWFLAALGAVLMGTLVYLVLSAGATASIAVAGIGPLRGVGWIVVVWAVPFIGAAGWILYTRRRNRPSSGAAPTGDR